MAKRRVKLPNPVQDIKKGGKQIIEGGKAAVEKAKEAARKIKRHVSR